MKKQSLIDYVSQLPESDLQKQQICFFWHPNNVRGIIIQLIRVYIYKS